MSSNDFERLEIQDLMNSADLWEWIARNHSELISLAATRLGAAVISGALGIAGAQLNANGSKLATPALAASGLFAAGFAGSAALDARSRRQVRQR
jgi:hypothetical protein